MKYFARIDLSVENNSHTRAFNFIKSFAGGKCLRVLEVGCSGGYFGKALVDDGHYVVGVEPDEESFNHASGLLNETYNGFLDDFFDNYSSGKFDIITFGDVLEHLVDPTAALVRSAKFLAPNGAIVASVPNVAHSSVRAMLLEGRWDYSDLGLLDRTHLRFFTRSSLIDMFSDASFSVLDVKPIKLTGKEVDVMVKMKLKPHLLDLVEDQALDGRFEDFQYVLIAKPVDNIDEAYRSNYNIKMLPFEGLRVAGLLPDTASTLAELRFKIPLQLWSESQGAEIQFHNLYKLNNDLLAWGDIFIMHRTADQYTLNIIDIIHKLGKKVIFDMDDLLTEIPEFLSHHVQSRENTNFLIKAIESADILTATTQQLLDHLPSKQNSVIVPNCTEAFGKPINHFDVPSNEVNILIASSDLILVDFLLEPLRLIQEKYNVKLHVVGPPSKAFLKAGLDVNCYDNMTYGNFRKFIRGMDNLIGIIPLDPSIFSSCKSPIKYFDYSLAGIPIICSNVFPYKLHVKQDWNGVLVDNHNEDIFLALESLVVDFEKRKLISENARKYSEAVSSYQNAISAWNSVFSNLTPQLSSRSKFKLDVSSLHIKRPNKIGWFLKNLVKASSYKKAIYIFRSYGLIGLFRLVITGRI